MTVQTLPGDNVVRIIVPSLDKNMKEIHPDKRKYVIQDIERMFTNANGGARSFDGYGTWQSDVSGEVRERITSIESHGYNPFSKNDLEMLSEELNQEVLMYDEATGVRAHFVTKDDSSMMSPATVEYSDGSKIVISKAVHPDNPGGDQMVLVEHYDALGNKIDTHYYPIEDYDDDIVIGGYMPPPDDFEGEGS